MARRVFSIIAGALAVLIALELLLQVLPTPSATLTGQYVDRHVTSYPPGHEFRSATGWSFLNAHRQRANEHGFIPDKPFTPSPDAVALIGDSLVEQSMLPVPQRLASVLDRALGGRPVYSMGLGGTGLFDYLERVRYAREKLGVNTFWIVIERADIRQSLCAGGVYLDACLDSNGEIRRVEKPPRDPVRDLLARSAMLQYFVGVLRVSPDRLLAMFRRNVPEEGGRPQVKTAAAAQPVSAGEKAVVERFLAELSRLDEARFGLIIDPEIQSLAQADWAGDQALAAMVERARLLGIPVVNPRAALAEYSTRTGLDMRVGPYDAHWNAHANCVIAGEMLRTFAQGGQPHGGNPKQFCLELR